MADEKSTGEKQPLGLAEGANGNEVGKADAEAAVREQLEALKAEMIRLKETAGLLAEGTGQLAVAQARSLRQDLREAVQANPLATLAGAAFIGYLFGLRHR